MVTYARAKSPLLTNNEKEDNPRGANADEGTTPPASGRVLRARVCMSGPGFQAGAKRAQSGTDDHRDTTRVLFQ